MKRILLLIVLLLTSPVLVQGAERISESDMFGDSASRATADTGRGIFEEAGLEISSANPNHSEKTTQLGGTFSTQGDFSLRDDFPLKDTAVSNPNILFLYLDSKLEHDARFLVRARAFYDPTGTAGGGFGNLSNPYGSGGNKNVKMSLQELKYSANLDQKIFLTVGRQKVKYGASRFFNPTDFLNLQALNFFLPSDERPGVDMVKAHIPSGVSNFYAAKMAGNLASSGNPAGSYFRGEVAYDGGGEFLGGGEMSLSGYFPRHQRARAGFDISQAVGDYDIYFEGATGKNSAGDWKSVYSLGAGRDIRYGDRASNILSLWGELFYAKAVAEYGIFSFSLPEPANLKDITVSNTTLYSLLDKSALSRLNLVYTITPEISGMVYAAAHLGRRGGVFHLPGQVADVGGRLDFNF